jgi:CheY-like chemotaxis protein
VLAIDDDSRVLDLYQRYLETQGYQVVGLQDPGQALEQARILRPFAITLDVMMPGRNGWQVIQDLKSDPATRAIPVIFCTIIEDEARGRKLGAADYLLKPILQEDLLNALMRLDPGREIRKVLVVDDDPEVLRLVQKILEPTGNYKTILAKGGQQSLVAMKADRPDIVLLDLVMDDLDGFQVLETMQADADLREIPVILVTGYEMNEAENRTLSAYKFDVFRKGNLKADLLVEKIANVLKAPRTSGNGAPNV